ncbi:MAG: hypothetical protein H7305_15625 [Gemmatimonadaceae bacterium]|nr:hypothetical protein [Gemmatimonadaceae bacterium]
MAPSRCRPTRAQPQGSCLDKGYDRREVYALLAGLRFTPHVRARGEEAVAKRRREQRARRGVVERTRHWTNRFLALLVRWEKRAANYRASLCFACDCVSTCFQRADLLV